MSTTTIRLPDDLKARLTAAAKKAGTTPHNFILQAIAEKTSAEETRRAFRDEAEARFARITATGETIPWEEMSTYLEGQMAGKALKRPTPRKLGR